VNTHTLTLFVRILKEIAFFLHHIYTMPPFLKTTLKLPTCINTWFLAYNFITDLSAQKL